MSEVLRLLNAEGKELEETPLTPEHVTKVLKLMDEGVISGRIA